MSLRVHYPSKEEARPQILSRALAALDYLVLKLENLPDQQFSVQGEAPEWAARFFGDDLNGAVSNSQFLSCFVETTASEHWHGDGLIPISSGIWSETLPQCDEESQFEAFSVRDGEGCLLIIRKLGDEFVRLQSLTQKSNERALEHRQLAKEVQKTDVLLQCIIHDINNPLNAMILNLQMLAKSSDERVSSAADLALEAAIRQRGLIRSITQIFSSEVSRLRPVDAPMERLDDIVETTKLVVQMHLSDAMRRSVSIIFENQLSQDSTEDLMVRSECDAYFRVVENLVLNALRHSPRDSTVRLELSEDRRNDALRILIEDSGPGVEESLVEHLFDPFTQGTENQGSMGLGLYFCNMTLERWQGSIRYEPQDSGARFIVLLPLMTKPKSDATTIA